MPGRSVTSLKAACKQQKRSARFVLRSEYVFWPATVILLIVWPAVAIISSLYDILSAGMEPIAGTWVLAGILGAIANVIPGDAIAGDTLSREETGNSERCAVLSQQRQELDDLFGSIE